MLFVVDAFASPRYAARMKLIDGKPTPNPYYAEIAKMARALGFNVKDSDFDYIDNVLLSRRALELLVRE